MYLVPDEKLDDVVLDLDDFYLDPDAMALSELYYLKYKYPKFKVTLFAIPYWENDESWGFFESIAELDWVQLGVHGMRHKPPNECRVWDRDDAETALSFFEEVDFFQNLFKAPSWEYSDPLYQVLAERDWICADLADNQDSWPDGLRVYSTGYPGCVHGHTWNLNNPDPKYNNGIKQIIERGVPWHSDTNFHFITEAV